MTYNVLSGMLSLYTTTDSKQWCCCKPIVLFRSTECCNEACVNCVKVNVLLEVHRVLMVWYGVVNVDLYSAIVTSL